MTDEVKITVIATGFESQRYAAIPTGGYSVETAQNAGQFSTRPVYSPTELKDEDINVPTFIRRQAD
jgi:hypothetical protein